jgi:hypothetical protein
MEDLELIRRYLAGRLSEAEEHMLQTRIVQDPEFRSEVEVTRALKDGMRELENRGEVSRLLAAKSGNRAMRLALAAGLAAVAAGLVTFYLEQTREAAGPTLAHETLRFELTRGGAAADVTWLRGSAPVELEMRFDVGLDPAATYVVRIWRTADGADRPALTRTAPSSPDGEVVLRVDGDRLPPGDYEIRVEPQPASDAAAAVTYTFAVRPEP